MEHSDDQPVKQKGEPPDFEAVWPSETSGDGVVRPNNKRTGAMQGKASFKRKAYCRMCGFPTDLMKNAHDGGTLDGNGAGGTVTKSTSSGTVANGTSYSAPGGDQAYRKGGGCPMCFSRNSSKELLGPDSPPLTPNRPGF